MKKLTRVFRLLSDPTRLRTLVLLGRRELCVCQVMGVLGVSQSLVSRNLSMLKEAGLLDERREGKLVFYSMKKRLPKAVQGVIRIVRAEAEADPVFMADLDSLEDCRRYQERAGRCDMKTFLQYMERRKGRGVRP